jgi:hypothetical protein
LVQFKDNNMWNTADGLRTLVNAEAQLVRETIDELVDAIRAQIDIGESVSLGIVLFDELSWQQQLAMLLKVAQPLLCPTVPAPTSSALLDATVAAIYAQMRVGVEVEIDVQRISTESWDHDTDRRQEIVRALRERRPNQNWLDAECVVMDEWDLAIEEVRSWVLADEDWNLGQVTLDASPDLARELKSTLGIDDDYFCDVPPDADARPPREVWADIVALIRGQRPDAHVFDL